MREAAQIVLQLVRYANRNALFLGPNLPELMSCLQVTNEERDELAEILKADIRETVATHPAYEQINGRLSRMSPDNPYGA